MTRAEGPNYFDRARAWAAALLLAAGAAAIIGASLEWVTIEPPPEPPPGTDFEGRPFGETEASDPYTGLEASDGWFVAVAGAVLIGMAFSLPLKRKSGSAWLAFLASMVIGGVAFADYNAVADVTSSINDRMEVVGDTEPAFGLTLVAAAGIAGIIASVLGVIATPSERARNG